MTVQMGWMQMSFSSDVKEELSAYLVQHKHCMIAELSGIMSMCSKIFVNDKGQYFIKISSENIAFIRKFCIYIKLVFNISPVVCIRYNVKTKKSHSYIAAIDDAESARKVLLTTGLITEDEGPRDDLVPCRDEVIKKECCKRAFLRGVFLLSGSISDPERFYHLEIVFNTREKAEYIQNILLSFHFDARIVQRKKYFVVYIKEGEQIVDLLNVMMAHRALLNLENVRVLKEVRNSVNRQVNCETANLNRIVSAAIKLIEDINYIKETAGLDYLSEPLREMANVRMENPEVSLKELGQMMSPPVGKSGVNHRLRKISEIADELRQKQNNQ